MAKKIVSALLGGIIVLLVLAFAFMIVWQNQSYLTPAITWLLCGCIAALAAFVIYVALTRIIDAVKHRGQDEESYNEEHIENILSGERARKKYTERSAESRRKRQEEQELRKEEKRTVEEERAIRKQEEFEAKRRAEREEQDRREEEAFRKKRTEDEEKIERIVEARKEAILRAAEVNDEEEQNLALAEAEALGRTIQEARKKLEEEDVQREQAKKERAAMLAAEREEKERRRTVEIESARKQAEAAEATRRRAAASAAQTQSFAPIKDINNLPEFNSQIIEKAVKAADMPVERILPAEGVKPADDLWAKMNNPKSAKPVLGIDESSEEITSKSTSWTYTPAKLPNAWKSESNKKIPGEMSTIEQTTSTINALTKEVLEEIETENVDKTRQAHAATAAKVEKPASSLAAKAEKSSHMRSSATGYAEEAVSTIAESKHLTDDKAKIEREQLGRTTSALSEKAHNAENELKKAEQKEQEKRPVNVGEESEDEKAKRPVGRPPKAKTEDDAEKPKRPVGRPPKPKTENDAEKPKRPVGRPPKPKVEGEEKPKRPVGRPPKPKVEGAEKPKRPVGRPPKPKVEGAEKPKRPVGRPPKAKTENESDKPKRPVGRPPKAKTENEENLQDAVSKQVKEDSSEKKEEKSNSLTGIKADGNTGSLKETVTEASVEDKKI